MTWKLIRAALCQSVRPALRNEPEKLAPYRVSLSTGDVPGDAPRKVAGKKEIPLSSQSRWCVGYALFVIERSINLESAEERLEVRQALSRPLVGNVQVYMRERLAKLRRGHDLAKAFK
jgi:transposase